MENKSNDGILNPFADGKQPFLTDLTHDQDVKVVKGKVKKKVTWDEQRNYATQVAEILETGDICHGKQAKRIRGCALMLEMGWVGLTADQLVLKLKSAYFCRVRHCPVCQWRRAKMWSARFFDAFPLIYADYPKMRYIFLTLTVANCHVSELRSTVQDMNKAFKRMSEKKGFPALGYVRSLEVTPEKDEYRNEKNEYSDKPKKGYSLIRKARPDYCHPHFHVLMAVKSSYFNGRDYLNKEDYAELWQQALRVDYKPVVDIRIVKAKEKPEQITNVEIETDSDSEDLAAFEALKAAIVEVVKYTVKPSDMVSNPSWFLEMVNQLHRTRAVSLGGIFKDYLKVKDDGDLVTRNELEGNQGGLLFNWAGDFKRYRYSGSKNQFKPIIELKPLTDIAEDDLPY